MSSTEALRSGGVPLWRTTVHSGLCQRDYLWIHPRLFSRIHETFTQPQWNILSQDTSADLLIHWRCPVGKQQGCGGKGRRNKTQHQSLFHQTPFAPLLWRFPFPQTSAKPRAPPCPVCVFMRCVYQRRLCVCVHSDTLTIRVTFLRLHFYLLGSGLWQMEDVLTYPCCLLPVLHKPPSQILWVYVTISVPYHKKAV